MKSIIRTGLIAAWGIVLSACNSSVATSSTQTNNYAYVTNLYSNSISMYSINSSNGTLTPLTPPTIPTELSPTMIAVDSSNTHAYVTNFGESTISIYSINPTTGQLYLESSVSTRPSPFSIALDKSSTHAYVTHGSRLLESTNCAEGCGVSVWQINPQSGNLTEESYISTESNNPGVIKLSSSGKYAYLTGYTKNGSDKAYSTIFTFMVLSNGILIEESALSISGKISITTALSPLNDYAYFGAYYESSNSSSINIYNIDSENGSISYSSSSESSESTDITNLMLDSSGTHAYASFIESKNESSTLLLQTYNIESSGKLALESSISLGAPAVSVGMTFDPSGTYAYINYIELTKTNSDKYEPSTTMNGSVNMLSVDKNSGLLTPIIPSSVSTQVAPIFITTTNY